MKSKPRSTHPYPWLVEPLEEYPTFVDKNMFSCRASYLEGRLVLVCASGDEPWNGVLVPTSREHHPSLQKEFSFLKPHPILGKWLYISQTHEAFEEVTSKIVSKIKNGDLRMGVESKPKKSKIGPPLRKLR